MTSAVHVNEKFGCPYVPWFREAETLSERKSPQQARKAVFNDFFRVCNDLINYFPYALDGIDQPRVLTKR